jgi:chromosome segregation ATPase
LDEVRASVQRLRHEGEQFLGRVREDARKLAERAPRPELPKSLADARDRAETTLRRESERVTREVRGRLEQISQELRTRRDQVLGTIQEQARAAAERAGKLLGAADAERVTELSREVTGLVLRVAELERKLTAISKKLKQQQPEAA